MYTVQMHTCIKYMYQAEGAPVDTRCTVYLSMQGVPSTEGPMIVMCVQRVNAVWHVKRTLNSFTESQLVKGQIYCES